MTERETSRLIAWSNELRQVHTRIRQALRVTRESFADGARIDVVSRDLTLFCHGFCAALVAHHQGEDDTLFPAVAAAHPELRPVLRSLEQDHVVIGRLVTDLLASVDSDASPEDLGRHLDGLEAIMENHFRYEEHQLLTVLDTLDLSVDPAKALGPP